MKPTRTFVILANEHEARFLENDGPGKGLSEMIGLEASDGTRYAERPGRSQAAPGGARHGFDRSETEREQDRKAFAAEVANAAAARWAEGGFDRAVLAAPPKMLGVLRAELDAGLTAAMHGDLDKDLLQVSAADLPDHFKDLIVF